MSSFSTKVSALHRFFEKELANPSSPLSTGIASDTRIHVGSDVTRFMRAAPNLRWTLARVAAREAVNISWGYSNNPEVEDLR